MKATDTKQPNYYHQVVDCQWACPAHTNIPEYIRLIAKGQFDDAYILNRESNVFPGILGRVCDRPCEPACRRGRLDDKPVAICRLKRVAADLSDDITRRIPAAPTEKNGKTVACIGAGCASLTVANDLIPLGYQVIIFEALPTSGGLMRTNIPAFRLPQVILEQEINAITDRGVDLRLNSPVQSMKSLLKEGYDAIFVGSGAPRGKNLNIPGRYDSEEIYIGIDWLESIAFGHIKSIGNTVLIIGAGNTAMDCCRSSLRLGATDVKVVARKPITLLKASDWELQDAIEEQVEIVCNHAPIRFILESGKLVGMEFSIVEWEQDAGGQLRSKEIKKITLPCDSVILAIGQENAFPYIEKDAGIEFDQWEVPVIDDLTLQSTHETVFFGGDSAFGPKNIIWAVEHGHQAAISIHNYIQKIPVNQRPQQLIDLHSTKMGIHEWQYSNDFDGSERRLVPHVDINNRFKNLNIEVELGFGADETKIEVERCLNCDIQTVFDAALCIECDACIDICPVDCLSIVENNDESLLRSSLSAPADNTNQALFVSQDLPQTKRVMVKDENICVHCGLCAERCPTTAWDMQQSRLFIPKAKDSICVNS